MWQHDRLTAARNEHLLDALRERDDRDAPVAEALQRREAGRELAPAAVDDDQVRQRRERLVALGVVRADRRIELRAAAAYMLTADRQTAGARYRSAYRSAIRLGARPLANRIAEEVAKLGEKVEQRLGRLAAAGVGRGGLSPRELEVTRLVASGLSSREVATTLSLSPRTVEMHVHRILSKLDCRTRVDITRRAAELGLLRT